MTELPLTIYSDGAARGNPGPAGAGALLLDAKGNTIAEVSSYLGKTTNNQAEYQALILALQKASEYGATSIVIYADSELMVKQINGEYKIKNDGLKPLFQQVTQSLKQFRHYVIYHVLREQNQHADRLANQAIDSVL